MSAPRKARQLADALDAEVVRTVKLDVMHNDAACELRRQDELLAACEPYLKDGETPAERIQRERRDTNAALTLLAREKRKSEAMLAALKRIRETRVFLGAVAQEMLDDAIKMAEEV